MKKLTTSIAILSFCSLLSTIALAAGSGPPAIEQCPTVAYPSPSPQPAPLHVDGQEIKDSNGRVVIIRGINTSGDSKVPDFMPLKDASMLDPLPTFGINALRLLFTWEAFEPNRCHYEESYIQYYEQVVQWAAERDLYVIIDFHQDAYSRYNIGGCGEGFPEWSVFSEVKRATPDNSKKCEGWGVKMIVDLDHHKSWEHFHKDTEGAKTRYLDMVTAVAERMSKHPNVIGYELINEPWGTDKELVAFYNQAGAAIRSRHPNTILFVPPHALASSGTANNMDKPNLDNMVYSPHLYDATVIMLSSWWGSDPSGPLNGMAKKAADWGVPMLLGEYGGPAKTKNIEGYMDALNGWLNKGLHHGTQWNYTPTWRDDSKDGWNHEDLSIVDNTGQLRPNFRARVYPTATAGNPITFEETANSAQYQWQHDASKGETELFIPENFMDNKTLTTSTGVNCQLTGYTLSCSSSNSGPASIQIQ